MTIDANRHLLFARFANSQESHLRSPFMVESGRRQRLGRGRFEVQCRPQIAIGMIKVDAHLTLSPDRIPGPYGRENGFVRPHVLVDRSAASEVPTSGGDETLTQARSETVQNELEHSVSARERHRRMELQVVAVILVKRSSACALTEGTSCGNHPCERGVDRGQRGITSQTRRLSHGQDLQGPPDSRQLQEAAWVPPQRNGKVVRQHLTLRRSHDRAPTACDFDKPAPFKDFHSFPQRQPRNADLLRQFAFRGEPVTRRQGVDHDPLQGCHCFITCRQRSV